MSIEQRRTYPLVDKTRQFKLLALVTVYNLVIAFFFGLSLFFPDFLSIEDENIPLDARTAIAERILYFHSRIWPVVIALICLIGLHSFRMVHRLIGPLFRFRWAFDQLQAGNIGFRIKLREEDYLHREEETFNRMMETLAPKLESARSECQAALQTVDDLLQSGEDVPAHLKERLNRTRMHLHALWQSADYFHMKAENPTPLEEKTLPEEKVTTDSTAPSHS